MINSNEKGIIAETAVMAELAKRGFSVLVPLGDKKYDVVAEKAGKFLRIQVKYVTPKGGILEVCCYCVTNRANRSCVNMKYRKEDVDYLSVYDPVNDNIYFVESVRFDGMKAISLRLEKTKNSQKKLINWADDFKELV